MTQRDRNTFDNLEFPLVRNVDVKPIADYIIPVKPDTTTHKIREQWTNHWGDNVTLYENGTRMTHSNGENLLYGDYGHAFLNGYYIIDEEGTMVFHSDPRYAEIFNKCRDMNILIDKIRKLLHGFAIERGRGDRLVVNDKIIKGILIYPGMKLLATIDETAEYIVSCIQRDIDAGRIQKGIYGIEKS